MALDDRMKNAADRLGGKAEETAGEATGNEELRAEGRGDQARADLQDALQDVKNKAEGIVSDLKQNFDKK